jgi:hypothetical protein
MILETDPVFPNNVVELIYERSANIDPDLERFRRPLRPEDPQQSLGVYAALWSPDDDSQEMKGRREAVEPTIQRYTIIVQSFVRDAEEERGLATHSVLSSRVRSMLYRDVPLQVGFGALSWKDPVTQVLERSMRWGIRNQRYISNEVTGSWLYLSSIEFWLETEII